MTKALEKAIKKAIEKNPHLGHPAHKRKHNDYYGRLLRKYIPIPLLIGIGASYLLFRIYGGHALAKLILDWIIGITIVATIIALISRKDNQFIKKNK